MTTENATPDPDPDNAPTTGDEPPRLSTGDELPSLGTGDEPAVHESGDAARRRRWSDGCRLAVGTLSVLPAPMPRVVDRTVAGKAMVLAPLVGLLLGGIAAAVVAGVHALQPGAPLLAAVLGVVVLVALSGALHLDGLADTADGLGSRRDRETMLRIMKQSDIGPFGVVAIVAVLLIDVAALTACIQAGFGWQAILIAAVASRLTLPWSCRTTVPSARPDGLGAMVAATVPALAVLITTALALAAVTLTTYASRGDVQLVGGAFAVVVAIAVGLLMIRRARTAFGGITGDTLGATVELALAAALLTLAVVT
ncbi:cobalamin-5'-phosphate synthase [Kribbella voronezhensis]|uniref:Adenosylcobinamide-GDP ribazoletransferase n=1 Tax=Kribbella voronezhensis TaxID=2512212 RepID=A0A4R7T619_9ACTN|nr:adenosylcobinamide-GDP ribazoletransferase [Kribbella voronezhensis]TDU87135.1 cobalamin-5'-phosphate synthase [Kribbella voronezhensis]